MAEIFYQKNDYQYMVEDYRVVVDRKIKQALEPIKKRLRKATWKYKRKTKKR